MWFVNFLQIKKILAKKVDMLKQDILSIVTSKRKILQLLKDITAKGFFHLLSANFIIRFLGFGSLLLVAKFLTPTELGQIRVMQSYIAVAAIVAGFGFNTAVLKLCSEKRPIEEKSYVFNRNAFYTGLFIIPTLFVLFLLSNFGLLSTDPIINRWFILYIIVIPATVYTALIMVFFQALKKIQLMSKAQVYIRFFGFVSLVLVTYFYGFVGFILSSIVIGYVALIPLIKIVKNNLSGNNTEVSNIFSQSFFLPNTV